MKLKCPKDFFGFIPGSDRTLADWNEMLSYFHYLDQNSPRVKLVEMGQ